MTSGSNTQFFGTRWDAPVVDDATQVDTPIGELCFQCEEPIVDGDRGLLTVVGRTGSGGELVGSVEPVHMECHLRSVVGSIAHLHQTCACVPGRIEPPFSGSLREEAIAVLDHWNARRTNQGLGPL